jgi:ECF sigma factor
VRPRVIRQGRAHFLAMSARIMRHVLVEAARARRYQRRGAGATRVTLDEGLLVGEAPDVNVIGSAKLSTSLLKSMNARVEWLNVAISER